MAGCERRSNAIACGHGHSFLAMVSQGSGKDADAVRRCRKKAHRCDALFNGVVRNEDRMAL